MKKAFFIFLSLLFVTVGESQDVDSLVNALNTQKQSPTEKMECYLLLYQSLRQIDVERAIFYSKE